MMCHKLLSHVPVFHPNGLGGEIFPPKNFKFPQNSADNNVVFRCKWRSAPLNLKFPRDPPKSRGLDETLLMCHFGHWCNRFTAATVGRWNFGYFSILGKIFQELQWGVGIVVQWASNPRPPLTWTTDWGWITGFSKSPALSVFPRFGLFIKFRNADRLGSPVISTVLS